MTVKAIGLVHRTARNVTAVQRHFFAASYEEFSLYGNFGADSMLKSVSPSLSDERLTLETSVL